MIKRLTISILATLGLTLGFTPIVEANYPAAPVVDAPTVTNQILVKSTQIQVNANLDNVQSVNVTVNGKVVKAEVTSDGKIIVGTLTGPKDVVEVKITSTNGVVANVEVDKSDDPISLANVNFGQDSSVLTKKARALLDRVAKIIKDKGFDSVSLVGFTDPDGSKAYNSKLSLTRANAVRAYLKSKGLTVKFSVDAQADDNPVADNNTKQGKALNRRVEIVVG